MSLKLLFKPSNRWLIGLLIAITIIIGEIAFYGTSQSRQVNQTASPKLKKTTPIPQKVTALGRLEPESEVIKLSAPLALNSDRVIQFLVKEGDHVKKQQVVAIMDSRDRLQDALQQAQMQVTVAQAKLAQVKTGAKTGEIKAQQATITRLQAELAGDFASQNAVIARWHSEVRTAGAEYKRYIELQQEGISSASSTDSKRLVLETAMAQLNEARQTQKKTAGTLEAQLSEAKANLDRIAEVRPVDVQVVQAEVKNANAGVKRAQTDLEQAYIRAPIAGQILKIEARIAEKIGNSDIADLASNDQMIAVADVYQTDISKVRLGQQAVITGSAFAGKLRGVVSQIGLQVNRQRIFSNQPGENFDSRVVEVKIRLNHEDSKRVAGLTNLQVQTTIYQ